jgi:hypothetical protein
MKNKNLMFFSLETTKVDQKFNKQHAMSDKKNTGRAPGPFSL